MGRVNKFTSGVFTNLVGNKNEIPTYDQFIKVQDLLSKPTEELNKYLELYKKKIIENKTLIETLAHLEDVIMEMRTRDNLSPSDIKLNVVREYIYARVTFHRKDKEAKDIRVIVGQTKDHGSDINKLYKKKKFMTSAKKKLIDTMNEIIDENIKLLDVSWLELITQE